LVAPDDETRIKTCIIEPDDVAESTKPLEISLQPYRAQPRPFCPIVTVEQHYSTLVEASGPSFKTTNGGA
jgi:hypothetical protein